MWSDIWRMTLIGYIALILFGCNNGMQYMRDTASVPGDFGKDFYACRNVSNRTDVFKQVYTTDNDFFTYRTPKVDGQAMEACLLSQGWKHP